MLKMFFLGLSVSIVCVSCSSSEPYAKSKIRSAQKMRVCLTTYSKYDDKWTKKGLTSTGMPLYCSRTCAVDPGVIPYGSMVEIPELGMKLKAVDTGSAVKSRKAAKRRGEPGTPVVDIYFERKSDAREFANTKPYFVEAEIYN